MVKGATDANTGFTTYTYEEDFTKTSFETNEARQYTVTVSDDASTTL